MPYTLEFDVYRRRVLFKATGTYGQAEAFQSIQDMLDHPDFQAGFDVLVDMTEVDEVQLLGSDIRGKADFDGSLIAGFGAARWAFVTPTDFLFGLARMYQALMQDTPIQVEPFRDRASAEAWLTGQ